MRTDQIHINFKKVIETLEARGNRRTNVAKAIGYTTTAILNNVLIGKSILSTRAIAKLIENFNINPVYIFMGEGDMFLSDMSEIEKTKKDLEALKEYRISSLETIQHYEEHIRKLEKRNADLIDITAAAVRYYENQQPVTKNEPNDSSLKRNNE